MDNNYGNNYTDNSNRFDSKEFLERQFYYLSKLRMQGRAKSLGIAALVTSIFFATVPIIGIVLACLAILFAFLAKGEDLKMSRDCRVAVGTSVAALLVGLYIMGSVLFALKINDEYRQNVAEYMDQINSAMYPEENMPSYGELLEKYFGKGEN